MALILEGSQPLLPSGGTSLPTASAAGELPVSAGAGTTYAATTAGDVVDAAIASVVGAVAGQAIVGDGLGGVTETSADVSAMLAAADAAAARAALGVTAASHTTGTFAAARALTPAVGDTFALTDVGGSLRCDVAGTWVWSHGGPLAASRGPFSGAGAWIAARGAAATAGPVGGPGYSFALGLHVVALPGATEKVLLAHDNGAVDGFFLGCADVTDNRIYLCQRGISAGARVKIELTDAVGSAHADLATGSYVIAVSIAPTAVRWSINGGAVGSLVISGTYAPPAATSRFVLMNFISSDFAPNAEVAFFQAFDSTLSDAALQALGAGHATYLPGNASAVPVASYLAGSHPRYDVSGQLVGTEGAALVVEPSTAGWTAR